MPPRAVRNGPGPVARSFQTLFRGVAAVWLGIAHAVGAGARGIGRSARDLEPEHRRDGAGLFLFGVAVIVAAAVWFEMPGGLMELMRTIVTGSVGKIGWLVPLVVVLAGWRVMRDPVHNGPAGRQVIGWTAFAFGILGIVHIANGSPEPVMGDTPRFATAAAPSASWCRRCCSTCCGPRTSSYRCCMLLSFFGLLVITATPFYRVPSRLGRAPRPELGRTPPSSADSEPTQPIKLRASVRSTTPSIPISATSPTTVPCSGDRRCASGAKSRQALTTPKRST